MCGVSGHLSLLSIPVCLLRRRCRRGREHHAEAHQQSPSKTVLSSLRLSQRSPIPCSIHYLCSCGWRAELPSRYLLAIPPYTSSAGYPCVSGEDDIRRCMAGVWGCQSRAAPRSNWGRLEINPPGNDGANVDMPPSKRRRSFETSGAKQRHHVDTSIHKVSRHHIQRFL